MPRYKDSPPAVRVYTICDESKYLIVRNIPALGCGDELLKLFASYGEVEEHVTFSFTFSFFNCLDLLILLGLFRCKPMDEEECEQFTDVYWIKFRLVSNARFAKRKLDEFVFLGNRLQVSYAPQYESLTDTKDKLEGRTREILARLNPGRSKGPKVSDPSGACIEDSLIVTPPQMNCLPQVRHSNQRDPGNSANNSSPLTLVSSDQDYFASQSMNHTVQLVRVKLNKIQSSSEDVQPAPKKTRVDNRRRI